MDEATIEKPADEISVDQPNSQDDDTSEQAALVSEEQAALDNLELITQLVQQVCL